MDKSDSPILKESVVAGRNSQGHEVRGVPIHLDCHRAIFEVGNSQVALRTSEVLSDFKLILKDQTLYSGRAVITNLLNTELVLLCEVALEEAWFDASLSAPVSQVGQLGAGFNGFLREWQKLYVVRPEFKIAVADLQTFLWDLRLWLEHVEVRLRTSSSGDGQGLAREVMEQLDQPTVRAINSLHERFEEIADRVDARSWPVHVNFTRRLVHSLFLRSPFAYRSYHKPLGYAGDYEMVNMIMRNPCEGASLFAQAINLWLLRQPLSEAHRNRISYLRENLVQETLRVSREGRMTRIFNLGCGPAHEIQAFLKANALCDLADFTLLDFNEETIEYVRRVLEGLKREFGRGTVLQFKKKSVVNILKEAVRTEADFSGSRYDLIYCAGLLDYLPDRVCKQLMAVFYQWLAPGGLMVITNVNQSEPFHMMECLLDWHLLYRNPRQLLALAPEQALPDQCSTKTDLTGANVFLEVRKPAGG